MTDCGCAKARAELEEYLHNELRQADAADIREQVLTTLRVYQATHTIS